MKSTVNDLDISALGLLSTTCLTSISFFFAFIVYERVISLASTYPLQRRLLLCISILIWYGTENAFEYINNSLELLLKGEANLSLEC